jgi:hypothetical protein
MNEPHAGSLFGVIDEPHNSFTSYGTGTEASYQEYVKMKLSSATGSNVQVSARHIKEI